MRWVKNKRISSLNIKDCLQPKIQRAVIEIPRDRCDKLG